MKWLLTLSFVALLSSATSGVAAQGFRDDELRRLSEGGLVVRKSVKRRRDLKLIGGTAFQVVNAPVDRVWALLRDPGKYTAFVPGTKRVVTVKPFHKGRGVVRVVHREGPVSVRYSLRMTMVHAQHMARFKLDKTRKRDIREGWGFFMLSKHEGNRCLITFGVMADIGTGSVAGFVRPEVHSWMLRIPSLIRQVIERPS